MEIIIVCLGILVIILSIINIYLNIRLEKAKLILKLNVPALEDCLHKNKRLQDLELRIKYDLLDKSNTEYKLSLLKSVMGTYKDKEYWLNK